MILTILILSILLTVSKRPKRSFYEILGVEKDASDRQIKKAYRKLALKWHPDKHPPEDREKASKRFTRISNAYEVLIDEEQRNLYDRFGEEGLKGGPSGGGRSGHPGFGNPNDIFSQFFGKSGFGHSSGGGKTTFQFGGGGGGFPGGGFPGGGGGFGGGRGGHRPAQRQGPSYTKRGSVKKLLPRKFPDDTAKFNWVVHFWGGEQQDSELKPALDDAAKELKGIIKVGFVDCLKYGVFCQEKGISDGSSGVYLYIGKRRLTYGGGPNAKKIRKFAIRGMSHSLKIVKESEFDKDALKAIENGIIIFSEKRKPAPFLKALSYEFRSKLSILFIPSKKQCAVEALSFETLPAAFVVEHGEARPIKGKLKPERLRKESTLLTKKKRSSTSSR